jgi:hypothetical protein
MSILSPLKFSEERSRFNAKVINFIEYECAWGSVAVCIILSEKMYFVAPSIFYLYS